MGVDRDEFLSEEDLDLKNLTFDQLIAWWNEWLRMAQVSNDDDRWYYSHGVFTVEPGAPPEAQQRIPWRS